VRVSRPRAWLTLVAFVLVLGAAADRADAQAFRPRGRGGAAAKLTPAPRRPTPVTTGARTVIAAPAPAARKAPAAAAARPAAAAKKAPAKKKKGGDDDDDVVVVDDDDDDE
jgi:hypothetical protein